PRSRPAEYGIHQTAQNGDSRRKTAVRGLPGSEEDPTRPEIHVKQGAQSGAQPPPRHRDAIASLIVVASRVGLSPRARGGRMAHEGAAGDHAPVAPRAGEKAEVGVLPVHAEAGIEDEATLAER